MRLRRHPTPRDPDLVFELAATRSLLRRIVRRYVPSSSWQYIARDDRDRELLISAGIHPDAPFTDQPIPDTWHDSDSAYRKVRR